MEKRYETRSGDLFVRSWARVRRTICLQFVDHGLDKLSTIVDNDLHPYHCRPQSSPLSP